MVTFNSMAPSHWCLRTAIGQYLLAFITLGLLFIISSSEAKAPAGEVAPLQEFESSSELAEIRLPDEGRVRRSAEDLPSDLKKEEEEYAEGRIKKAPRGFLGLRGKKAPSSFLGMRGRREDPGEDFSVEDAPFEDAYDEVFAMRLGSRLDEGDAIKRAPSGFLGMRGKKAPSGFLGMRGKKAPSGFLGMRGKKAPSSFLGMRGKKAPSSFLGMRGKKDYDNYDDLEDVLQALRNRYTSQDLYEQDKRGPRGFLGLRGKKSEGPVVPGEYYSADQDGTDGNAGVADKRVPSAFLGLRG